VAQTVNVTDTDHTQHGNTWFSRVNKLFLEMKKWILITFLILREAIVCVFLHEFSKLSDICDKHYDISGHTPHYWEVKYCSLLPV